MKIFSNLKSFDLKKPFKPWFRKILINTCINNLRKKKIVFTGAIEEVNIPSNQADILSSISYDEILEMIRKLSPAYRTVFNLYVIEGYKHEEIAEMLAISIGTSKSNLSKAKKQMQIILREYFQEDYEQIKHG